MSDVIHIYNYHTVSFVYRMSKIKGMMTMMRIYLLPLYALHTHACAHTRIRAHTHPHTQDDELKDAVTDLMKGVNLAKVTNNSICKKVFEKFPGVDLTSKKDFIKSCIQKTIASSI